MAGHPSAPAKLLGTAGLKLKVALACTAVLIVGALLAPPRSTPTALSPLTEGPAPLILQQVEQRQASEPGPTLQTVGPRVRDHSVAIPAPASTATRPLWDHTAPMSGLPMPAGFGVLVNADGHVLTHAAALHGRATLSVQTPGGITVQATLLAFEPQTGLALLRISSSPGLVVPPLAATRATPGAQVAAVATWAGRDIVVPAFLTSTSRDGYSLGTIGTPLAGTPVYAMDGELLAIVGDNGPTPMAFPAAEAVARLTALAAAGAERHGSLGLAIQPIDANLSPVFGTLGVLIAEVVEGGPADGAGVDPGDVLLAIGDLPVNAAEDVWRAMTAIPDGTMTTLDLTRAGRALRLDVTAASAFAVVALARGPAQVSLSSYPQARELLSPAQLAASRVPPEARVLHVNDMAITTPAQFDREVGRTGRPDVLYLALDGQRFFAVLPQP